jgi:hypothetical protein
MRLIFEIANRYFQLETGEIHSDEIDEEIDEDDEAEEPDEFVRLPIGFQPPPPAEPEVEDDDETEYETPEVDNRPGGRGRCTNGAFPEVLEAATDL